MHSNVLFPYDVNDGVGFPALLLFLLLCTALPGPSARHVAEPGDKTRGYQFRRHPGSDPAHLRAPQCSERSSQGGFSRSLLASPCSSICSTACCRARTCPHQLQPPSVVRHPLRPTVVLFLLSSPPTAKDSAEPRSPPSSFISRWLMVMETSCFVVSPFPHVQKGNRA